MNLTQDEITLKIKTRLGYGARCLGLMQIEGSGDTIDHYAEATSRALDMFNQYINRRERGYVYVTGASDVNGESSYVDLSADEDLLSIADVEFLVRKDYNSVMDLDVFNLTGRLLTSSPFTTGTVSSNRIGPGTPITTITELLAQRKSVMKARSLEPDWLWDPTRKWLVLYHPASPYDVNYLKVYAHTIATLPETLKSRFLDAVEAYCRLTLADVMGMFGGEIPGPTGPVTMDVDYQRQRGDTMLQKIESYLKNYPVVPVVFEG